jgi:hypothetical protein
LRFNSSASAKVRAGRVLIRCHAALREGALSVSAFDAAIGLAKPGQFLLSEALAIRSRANAGQGAGTSALHWDTHEGSRQLAEVAERMQGCATRAALPVVGAAGVTSFVPV